jgi:acetyl esterase/lipase
MRPASHASVARPWLPLFIALLLVPAATSQAAESAQPSAAEKPGAKPETPAPAPTAANVAYGPHARNRLDVWRASGTGTTPVVIFFHGGSWQRGTRSSVERYGLARFLAAGISVVTADYRFIHQAQAAKVQPPVQWPLDDAARVVQFVRSKATTWGLDSARIGLSGSSAGACSALWLGMHDDLADPSSTDAIARESTRVACVGVNEAQSSLDPRQIHQWFGQVPSYGLHAFGFDRLSKEETPAELFARSEAARDSLLPWIREYSPIEHASADDPPIALYFPKKPPGDTTHGALFGVKLQERLTSLGVECRTLFPGGKDTGTHIDFLIAKLAAAKR